MKRGAPGRPIPPLQLCSREQRECLGLGIGLLLGQKMTPRRRQP